MSTIVSDFMKRHNKEVRRVKAKLKNKRIILTMSADGYMHITNKVLLDDKMIMVTQMAFTKETFEALMAASGYINEIGDGTAAVINIKTYAK